MLQKLILWGWINPLKQGVQHGIHVSDPSEYSWLLQVPGYHMEYQMVPGPMEVHKTYFPNI